MDDNPIRVEVRPLLTSATLIKGPGYWRILIGENQSKEEAAESAWHEIVHILKKVGDDNQDEEEVEQSCQKLAAACPEILKWLGIENKFK